MTHTRDLACREVVELVTVYLEGALSDEQRASIEAHLNECGGCSAYLDQIRMTIELTGRLTQEDLPSAFRTQLVTSFRSWSEGRRR
jgi:predicted anti-sigma-YlaC factor YlaD